MGCCNPKESNTNRKCFDKLRGIHVDIKSSAVNIECRLELTGRLTLKQINRVPKLELENNPLYSRRKPFKV